MNFLFPWTSYLIKTAPLALQSPVALALSLGPSIVDIYLTFEKEKNEAGSFFLMVLVGRFW